MKKHMAGLITVLALDDIQAVNAGPVIHINDFSYSMLDGDGNLMVTTTDSRVVITNSNNGSANLKCFADVVLPSNGKAVHYNFENTGVLCGTIAGVTDKWYQTVSAGGDDGRQATDCAWLK